MYKKHVFKIFLLICFIGCIFLGIWQISRYNYKKNQYQSIKIFQENLNKQQYKQFDKTEKLNSNDEFKKLIFCGNIQDKEIFALYHPYKDSQNLMQSGYQLILPLTIQSTNETVLIGYKIFNNIKQINLFLENLKQTSANKESCFSGITIPINKMQNSKLVEFFINFGKKNIIPDKQIDKLEILINLNEKYLIKYKTLCNSDIKYFVDTQRENLNDFLKNYQHHLYYCAMWFSIAVYILYIIRKIST